MENDRLVTLVLNCWPSPQQRTRRLIDLRPLGHVNSGDILLMGSDAKNNLYFQYRYPSAGDKWTKAWRGPMGIAMVSSDNKAQKIFDIYEHYRNDVKGVGDIIHVSANGDLYLEVADATHYRIDKISFPQER